MDNLLPLCAGPGGKADNLHLVLCPFAGGITSAFRSWCHLQLAGMQVSLFVYPGRDHRTHEPRAASIGELADRAVEQIEAKDIDPHRLIVACHSMGSQVAYEVCARLEQRCLTPRGLVLSGCHAPHLRGRRRISHLEDRAFLEELAVSCARAGCNGRGPLLHRSEPGVLSGLHLSVRGRFLSSMT